MCTCGFSARWKIPVYCWPWLHACTSVTARVHTGICGKIVTPHCICRCGGDPVERVCRLHLQRYQGGFRVGFGYRGRSASVRQHYRQHQVSTGSQGGGGQLLSGGERKWQSARPNSEGFNARSAFGVIPKSEPGKWHLTHQHRRVAVCMTELAGLGDGAQVTNGEVVGS